MKIFHRRFIFWLAVSGLLLLCMPGLLLPLVLAQSLPDEAYLPLTGRAQAHELSCEARSASDWAAYLGYTITEENILAALPRTGNPETGFVGDPDGIWGRVPPHSYGVHPPPVAAVLRDNGVPARAVENLTWDDLRAEIAAGRPVIIWVIGQMWNGYSQVYTADDGQSVTVANFEHTMIVTGYNSQAVHVFDAYYGLPLVYDIATFLSSWRVLGYRAIIAEIETAPSPLPPTETPTPTITPTATLTPSPYPTSTPLVITLNTIKVQAGDTLLGLAQRWKTTWEKLAQASQLEFPYFIYPGDILRLPDGITYQVTATPNATATPSPTDTPQPPTPTLTPSTPETYVVQRGDYLTAIADRFGLDWRTLAQINGIGYPYTVYPGQVLRLR
jgi:LysM repeat protein